MILTTLIAVATSSTTVDVESQLQCVRLSGTRHLIAEVAAALSPPRPCRAIRVRLSWEDGGLLVERAGDVPRRASNAAVAAAIIESWAAVSIAADLIAGPADPPPAPVVRRSPSAAPVVVPIETQPTLRSIGVAARVEATVEEDLVVGLGLHARVDTQLLGVVPWIGGRLVMVPTTIVGSGTSGRRTMADALVGVEVPLSLGRFTVAPGLAGGIGFIRTSRALPDLSACNRVRCGGIDEAFIDDDFTNLSIGPRFEGGVRVMHPLGDDVGIEMSLALSVSPLAERGGPRPKYAIGLDDAVAASLALPAEGRFGGRIGFGIRWGTW